MPDKPSDNDMPTQRIKFTLFIIDLLREKLPTSEIEITSDQLNVIIDGRYFDVENVYRISRQNPEQTKEAAFSCLHKMIDNMPELLRAEESLSVEEIRARIMPRIHSEAVFGHLSRDNLAYVPYVNDTIIAFVFDAPEITVSITRQQLDHWRIPLDEAEELARHNLSKYKHDIEINIIVSKDGGTCAMFAEQDGYDAARLLLPDLHERLAPKLGGNFYVGIPSRDLFVAMSAKPKALLDRLLARLNKDYADLPYPIVPGLFYVTRDGVCAGVIE